MTTVWFYQASETNGEAEEELPAEEEEEDDIYGFYWQSEDDFRLTGGVGPPDMDDIPPLPSACDSESEAERDTQEECEEASRDRPPTPEIIFVNDSGPSSSSDRFHGKDLVFPSWAERGETLSDEIMSSSSEDDDDEVELQPVAAAAVVKPATVVAAAPVPPVIRKPTTPPPPPRPVTEEEVDALHNQALPNVNGNYDCNGQFRPWHECVVVESFDNDLLPLLPFVVIE